MTRYTAVMVQRKWEIFPGRNRFCLNGRLMTGRDIGLVSFTGSLIVVCCCLFIAFDGVYLSHKLSIAVPIIGAILFLFTLTCLLRTTFTDPGIIPRATASEIAYLERMFIVDPTNGDGPTAYRPPPRVKEITVNGVPVKLKYCYSCKIFRPPRASHCSFCDNCVGFSITNLVLRSFEPVVQTVIIFLTRRTVFNGIVSFLALWSVIKGSWAARRGEATSNPYSHGSALENFLAVSCGPFPPSLIDVRGTVGPEDEEALALHKRATAMPYQVGQYNLLNDTNPNYGSRSINNPTPNTLPAVITQPGYNHNNSQNNSSSASEVPLPSEVPEDAIQDGRVQENNNSRIGAAV
ncbi:putative palmitoyltransferase ZDHHC14 [Trichoplax sp. H2]|nr:putative palmitoyltransferase ZDHHC14 [Trichoplax sp. H2]|eukprot:RDD46738.1 putative palmitoyltransferase ZDHHC14 [Trichoplax sp. H2]